MKYAALFALLLIGSCSQATSESQAQSTPKPSYMSDLYDGNAQIMEPTVIVFTDPETKCQYLIMQDYHQGGITARQGRDGHIMCLDQ